MSLHYNVDLLLLISHFVIFQLFGLVVIVGGLRFIDLLLLSAGFVVVVEFIFIKVRML
jgi:hypothetical protein